MSNLGGVKRTVEVWMVKSGVKAKCLLNKWWLEEE
jgi:hypothetical protein